MWDLLNSLLRGLQVGSVYAIVGLGLNVIFAATGVSAARSRANS